MTEQISTYLFTQGILGIAVVVLAFVCLKLYNKTDELQKALNAEKDLRLADSKEMMKEVTEVMRDSIQSDRILSEKIEVAKSKGSI